MSSKFRYLTATLITLIALGCGTALTSTNSTATTYYLHWNCGGQNQCASVFGANTGIQATYTVLNVCITQLVAFANNNTIQEWNGKVGDWCDNSASASETGPAAGF